MSPSTATAMRRSRCERTSDHDNASAPRSSTGRQEGEGNPRLDVVHHAAVVVGQDARVRVARRWTRRPRGRRVPQRQPQRCHAPLSISHRPPIGRAPRHERTVLQVAHASPQAPHLVRRLVLRVHASTGGGVRSTLTRRKAAEPQLTDRPVRIELMPTGEQVQAAGGRSGGKWRSGGKCSPPVLSVRHRKRPRRQHHHQHCNFQCIRHQDLCHPHMPELTSCEPHGAEGSGCLEDPDDVMDPTCGHAHHHLARPTCGVGPLRRLFDQCHEPPRRLWRKRNQTRDDLRKYFPWYGSIRSLCVRYRVFFSRVRRGVIMSAPSNDARRAS